MALMYCRSSGRDAVPSVRARQAEVFSTILKDIDRSGGLAPFRHLGARLLIALDGSEHFCSRNIFCPQCSTRKRSDGGAEYFHSFVGATLVAPGHRTVLPLPPEFVRPQDGASKPDCEPMAAASCWSASPPATRPSASI